MKNTIIIFLLSLFISLPGTSFGDTASLHKDIQQELIKMFALDEDKFNVRFTDYCRLIIDEYFGDFNKWTIKISEVGIIVDNDAKSIIFFDYNENIYRSYLPNPSENYGGFGNSVLVHENQYAIKFQGTNNNNLQKIKDKLINIQDICNRKCCPLSKHEKSAK